MENLIQDGEMLAFQGSHCKVRKTGWGRPCQSLAGERLEALYFYRLSICFAGADYRERLNSLSLTHMLRFYGWLMEEGSLQTLGEDISIQEYYWW